MNIVCEGLRDRRVAASDETVSVRGGESRVYRRGSVAREHGAHGVREIPGRRAARYDRQPGAIRAIVLHQTAGSAFTGSAARRLPTPDSDNRLRSAHRIDQIAAHFLVLHTGTIFYTHDVQYLVDSAGGEAGIDIEVAGSLPTSVTPDPHARLPVEAIRALRNLLRALIAQLPVITHIHPHGQIQTLDGTGPSLARCGGPSSANPCDKIVSCPGPDIWMNVGHWACQPRPRGLGLSSVPAAPYQDNGIVAALANPAYVRDDI